MKKFFLTIFILGLLLVPPAVLAATQGGLGAAGGVLNTVGSRTGLGNDLNLTFGSLAKGLLGAVGTIFFFLTIYAGILWLTAAGNEERITKAKTVLFTCVIGLFITMSAYAITNFITKRLGGSAAKPPIEGEYNIPPAPSCCVVRDRTKPGLSGQLKCENNAEKEYCDKIEKDSPKTNGISDRVGQFYEQDCAEVSFCQ